MAKTGKSYLDGFKGRLGPVVGYQWNGVWCMRSRPRTMHNPRTDKQMEHRTMFKQEVQLAASMRWAVTMGLTDAARERGLTAYNLFVSLNQPCFGLQEGALAVDYASLTLSMGPLAPIALGTPLIDEHNTLTVSFEKNPLRMRTGLTDLVHLFIYCPTLKQGLPAEPVFRSTGRVAVVLPDWFRGHEVHVYGFVVDDKGRCSATSYAAPESEPEVPAIVAPAPLPEPEPHPAAEEPASVDEPAPPVDPMQLTLW